MWPFQAKQRYEQVANEEYELKTTSAPPSRDRPTRRGWLILAGIAFLTLILTFVAWSSASFVRYPHEQADNNTKSNSSELYDDNPSQSSCPKRREWRTLSTAEQQAYISAVLCLRDQPSALAPSDDKSSYDDFPWIHSHVGYYTHNSAPFLPWHRYFLHIYERTLREDCGYEGSLVYWDWTLDSHALEASPVFSAESGFGGDGQVGGEITVGRSGRCLVDGPFKNVTANFYDVKFKPHCLSRGFRNKAGELGHIDGEDISPASIEEVLSLDSYEESVALMESRVHDAIPFGIGGDFETFTAPYDPIFFLHHTQLDRLWWLWQQRGDPNAQHGERMYAYGGHKQRHSIEMARLDDEIDMKGLAPNIEVREVMETDGQLLCYRY